MITIIIIIVIVGHCREPFLDKKKKQKKLKVLYITFCSL